MHIRDPGSNQCAIACDIYLQFLLVNGEVAGLDVE